MTNAISHKGRHLFLAIATFLMFFYRFQSNLSFIGLPSYLHSARIAWALFMVWALKKKCTKIGKDENQSEPKSQYLNNILRFYIILLFYSFFLLLTIGKGEGVNLYTQVINILFFGFTLIWAWKVLFNSLDEFMWVLLLCGIIQAIVITICLIQPAFGTLLDLTFNYDAEKYNYFSSELLRSNYAGGIGCIAAPGLINYSSCIVASLYFYLKRNNAFFLVLFFFLGFIGTMIARTGLIFFAIMCFFLLFQKKNKGHNFGLLIWFFLFIILVFLLFKSEGSGAFLSQRFDRYRQLHEDHGELFFETYFHGEDTQIPPINIETFWGCGMISGKSGNGYVVNVDGGILRMYGAIGIIGVIIFYLTLLRNMFLATKTVTEDVAKKICQLLLILMLVGELKENVFIMVGSVPLFCICVLLSRKREQI